MRGKDHAGIHTGRNDRNGRPRGSRRRTALDRQASEKAFAAGWEAALANEFEDDPTLEECFEDWWSEAEAGHESVDGVHPDET